MSDIFDGLGTAAEGGLFARAFEPDSGAKSPHPHQPENCLNCGVPLSGAYCSACGQQGHVHRTIGGFMHDLMHGALHFEGKFWHTLPMLVFKPGQLTRRYIEGQRARFVSPMALFLFGVFLMFAVFQMVGLTAPTEFGNGPATARVQAETALAQEKDKLAELDAAEVEAGRREEIETRIAGLERALQLIDTGENFSFQTADGKRVYQEVNLTGIDAIDRGVVKKWRANPGLMLYKMQANFYKFSWLLIPLSIPFVWLLFAWKRRFRAYDHAIFVTYSLSFMTLLFVVLSLFTLVPSLGWLAMTAMVFIPPFHLYKQLRYGYDLSRFSAFWRLMVLSLFIWVILLLFLQVLLLLGAY